MEIEMWCKSRRVVLVQTVVKRVVENFLFIKIFFVLLIIGVPRY